MWEPILAKIRQLAALDRQHKAFGAYAHHYAFRPPASSADLAASEQRLGAALPPELRALYVELGDGGAGPGYGLLASTMLQGRGASSPYPGVAALREAARRADASGEQEDPYFEAPYDSIVGLIPIIEEGCGHQTCLVASGPSAGRVVHVSSDGFVVEAEGGLRHHYERWLDVTITQFEAVRTLMDAGVSFEALREEMVARHQLHGVGDLVASIADVETPTSIFGTPGARVYHGATQLPWYEDVLAEYQARRARTT